MKYLYKKLYRDVLKLWPQFTAVFVMAFLAMTIYSGMEGVWYGMSKTSEKYFEDTNLCDGWVYGNGITDEQFETIKSLSGVEEATRAMSVVTDVNFGKEEEKADVKLVTVADLATMDPLICHGEEYGVDSEGIWLDEMFADERGFSVGDVICLSYQGIETELTIKGLILDSEYIYYTGTDELVPEAYAHGYAIMSEKQAEKIFGGIFYNQIRVNMEEGFDKEDFKEQVKEILIDNFLTVLYQKDVNSVYQVAKETDQMRTLSMAYCSAFTLLVILTMYTTMSRLVNNQRIIIGTLKAIGFADGQIRFHYALYGLVVSIVGGFAGSYFGRNTVSRAIIKVKQTTLTLPEWNIQVSVVSYLIILVIGMICTLSAIAAANKNLSRMPSETMRGENEKSRQNKKVGKQGHLSNQWTFVLRNISRNKVRYIMGVVGIAGSMTLMFAAFGIRDSLKYSNEYVYGKQYDYSYKSILTEYDDDTEKEVEALTKKAQYIAEKSVTMEYGDKIENAIATIVSDGDYIHLVNMEGEAVELTVKSVFITKKVAELLDVEPGDEIKLHIIGMQDTVTVLVEKVVTSPAPQGIFLSEKAWENMGYEYCPTAVLTGKDCIYNDLIKVVNVSKIVSITEQSDNLKIMSDSLEIIVVMLIGASLVLGFVIQYNLGMLNFVERLREYATMKVLGFYQIEIQGLGIRDCIMIIVPGWLIGICTGRKYLIFLTKLVSSNSFQWIAIIRMESFAIITLLTVGVSFGIVFLINHKVKDIDMVEALKSVE